MKNCDDIEALANFFVAKDESGVELPSVCTFLWRTLEQAFKLGKVKYDDFAEYF